MMMMMKMENLATYKEDIIYNSSEVIDTDLNWTCLASHGHHATPQSKQTMKYFFFVHLQ